MLSFSPRVPGSQYLEVVSKGLGSDSRMVDAPQVLGFDARDMPLLGLAEGEGIVADASEDAQKTPKAIAMGLVRRCCCEFIGTFFLASTIELAAGQDKALAPIAIGGILTVMVFAFGHVSGAHFNPAVTLGVFIRGDFEIWALPAYIASQCLGALAGAIVQFWVLKDIATSCMDDNGGGDLCGAGYPAPNPEATLFSCVITEALWTFALVSVVLNVATTKSQGGNSFFGLAIGVTVLSAAIAAGDVSGGAFNPAIGTALPLVHLVWQVRLACL